MQAQKRSSTIMKAFKLQYTVSPLYATRLEMEKGSTAEKTLRLSLSRRHSFALGVDHGVWLR
jgi:hypothetical protein